MAKVSQAEGNRVVFWCPGCERAHMIHTNENGWTWDGNVDAPTINPSVLVKTKFPDSVCHSFVKNGRIQFLNDSTHPLGGQTVDLPDWPYGDLGDVV